VDASELEVATREAKEWLASHASIEDAWRTATRPDLLLWLRRQLPVSEKEEQLLVMEAISVAGTRQKRRLKIYPPTDLELAYGWPQRDVPPFASIEVLYAPLLILGPVLAAILIAINLLDVPRALKAATNIAIPTGYHLLLALHHTLYTSAFRRRVRKMTFDEAFTLLWLAARRSCVQGRSPKLNEISLRSIRRNLPLPKRATS
jgi:hypothetical protein